MKRNPKFVSVCHPLYAYQAQFYRGTVPVVGHRVPDGDRPLKCATTAVSCGQENPSVREEPYIQDLLSTNLKSSSLWTK